MNLTKLLADLRTAVSFSLYPFSHPIRVYEIRETVAVIGLVFVSFTILFPIIRTATRYGDVVIDVIAALIVLGGLLLVVYDLDLYLRYLRSLPLAISVTFLDLGIVGVSGFGLYLIERALFQQFALSLERTIATEVLSTTGFGIGLLAILIWFRRRFYTDNIEPKTAQESARLDCKVGLMTRAESLSSRLLPTKEKTNEKVIQSPQRYGDRDRFSYEGFENEEWVWSEGITNAVNEQIDKAQLSLVQGPAGSGKSSFLHFYSYQKLSIAQVFFFHMGQDLDGDGESVDRFVETVRRFALNGTVIIVDDVHKAPVEAETLVERLQNLSIDLQVVLGTRMNFPSYRREARARVVEQVDIPDNILQTFFMDESSPEKASPNVGEERPTEEIETVTIDGGSATEEVTKVQRDQDFESLEPVNIWEFHRLSLQELVDAAFQRGELEVEGGMISQTGFKRQFSEHFSRQPSLVLAGRLLDQLKGRQQPLEPSRNVYDFERETRQLLRKELDRFWNQTTKPTDSAERHANRFQALLFIWITWGYFESPINTSIVSKGLDIKQEETERLLSELRQDHLILQSGEEEREFTYQSTHHPMYASSLLKTIMRDGTRPKWFAEAANNRVRTELVNGRPIRIFHPYADEISSTPLSMIGANTYERVSDHGETIAERGVGALWADNGYIILDSLYLLVKVYDLTKNHPLEESDNNRLVHSLWAVLAASVLNLTSSNSKLEDEQLPVQPPVKQAVDDFITIANDYPDQKAVLLHGYRVFSFSETMDELYEHLADELQQEFLKTLLKLPQEQPKHIFIEYFIDLISGVDRFCDFWTGLSEANRAELRGWLIEKLQSGDDEIQLIVFQALKNSMLYLVLWHSTLEDDEEIIDTYGPYRMPETWERNTEDLPQVANILTDLLSMKESDFKNSSLDLIRYTHIFDSLRSLSDSEVDEMLVQSVTEGVLDGNTGYWNQVSKVLKENFDFWWSSWDEELKLEIAETTLSRLQSDDVLMSGPATVILRNDDAVENIGQEISIGHKRIGKAIIQNLTNSHDHLREDSWQVLTEERVFRLLWDAIDDSMKADFKQALLEVLQSPYGPSQNRIFEMFQNEMVLRNIIQLLGPEEQEIFKQSIFNILNTPLEFRRKINKLFRNTDYFDILVGDDGLFTRAEFASDMYNLLTSPTSHPGNLYVFCYSDQFNSLIHYILTRDSKEEKGEKISEFWDLPPAFDCCWENLSETENKTLLNRILQEIAYPDTSTKADLFRALTHPEIFETVIEDTNKTQINRLYQQHIQLLISEERMRMVAFEMLAPEENFSRIWSRLSTRQQRILMENIFQPSDERWEKFMRNVALANVELLKTLRDFDPKIAKEIPGRILENISEGPSPLPRSGFLILIRRENLQWLWSQWSEEERRSISRAAEEFYEENIEDDSYASDIASALKDRPYIQKRLAPYLIDN